MQKPQEELGGATFDAIDAGRYQTFTNPLGTAGRAISKIVGKYPALRFITRIVKIL